MGGTNQLKFRSLPQIGCYGGYQVATFEAHHVTTINQHYTALRGAVFPGILERPSAVRLQQICSFSLKTVISKDTTAHFLATFKLPTSYRIWSGTVQ